MDAKRAALEGIVSKPELESIDLYNSEIDLRRGCVDQLFLLLRTDAAQILVEHRAQLCRSEWFAHVVVHTRLDAPLTVFRQGPPVNTMIGVWRATPSRFRIPPVAS